ncbi:serine/threonine protein kinase-like protein [Dendryphion nanum]|uniref:Serine/threonine protein kinase-like protein n=1 Tax=Dendryphion nanum TaxID=256645 RepID=A0A9P9IY29_9PLEO|nr:serine/threonine protein kinase-like protein [Dendryphion nanum]
MAAVRSENPSSTALSRPFTYDSKEWVTKDEPFEGIEILGSKTTKGIQIVRKFIPAPKHISRKDWQLPYEVDFLDFLPECNRVVKHLHYFTDYDGPYPGCYIIFEHYPLGDMRDWRRRNFDKKNNKPVPESYIWRMFGQLAQALAFIHNHIGPNRNQRTPLIHRDIKPRNVLVASTGTTYPSFKLHDFGCATFLTSDNNRKDSLCGTHEWQPPENPHINSEASDIWSLGALVHFLAIGCSPVQRGAQDRYSKVVQEGPHYHQAMEESEKYTSWTKYIAAKVPRVVTPINLTPEQQEETHQGIYNTVYSDSLDKWMKECLKPARSRANANKLIQSMLPDAMHMLFKCGGRNATVDMNVEFRST